MLNSLSKGTATEKQSRRMPDRLWHLQLLQKNRQTYSC